MVIAVQGRRYIRPHRQRSKEKSYTVLEGELTVMFWNDAGEPLRSLDMSAPGSGQALVHRFAAGMWHTVVPRSETVIYVETIAGPFLPGGTEWAPWAPEEGDAEGVRALLTEGSVSVQSDRRAAVGSRNPTSGIAQDWSGHRASL